MPYDAAPVSDHAYISHYNTRVNGTVVLIYYFGMLISIVERPGAHDRVGGGGGGFGRGVGA